jgi:hypothetical protein|uniref:Uncharacterized protein n=1 Tax=Zea mays TaxID=4577 RepID=B6UCN9_MAIZE|nr:hypothetical protein [Zea mays]
MMFIPPEILFAQYIGIFMAFLAAETINTVCRFTEAYIVSNLVIEPHLDDGIKCLTLMFC